MAIPFKRQLLATLLAAALGAAAPAVLAQSASEVDQVVVEVDRSAATVPNKAATRMAQEFAPLVGSEDDALKVVQGLRSGTAVTFEGETPDADVTIEPTAQTGYGNVFITLALAQSSLKEAGITAPTLSDLAVALNGGTIEVDGTTIELQGVLAMRASGMGWGEIAKANGVKLGRVISAIKSGKERYAQGMKAEVRAEKRAAKADTAKAAGTEKAARAERSTGERSAKAERGAKPDGVQRVEKAERIEKAERPEKVERPEKAERPERPEKVDRPGRG